MQLSILQRVTQIIQQSKLLPTDKTKAFVERFSRVDATRPWIYPGAFKRDTGIDIQTIYRVLYLLEKEEIVRPYLELQCPQCGKTTGNVYQSVSELPDDAVCPNCENDITNIKNYVVIYREIAE
ncbi:MAG: hypothetical protein ACOYIH_09760 [Candidatus Fimadaptatus sp.]